MNGRDIRQGTVIGKRIVLVAQPGTRGMFVNGKPAGTERVRHVTFTDGTKRTYVADAPVPGARGYVESLPAGNAPSKLANNAERVRAHDGRWRGESTHGMTVREHDLVASTNMYDFGRVNGTVGVTR